MEPSPGGWRAESWEALAAGRHIASELSGSLEAAVVGPAAVDELASKDVDRIHVVEDRLLDEYTADAWTAALEALIRSVSPSAVLFPDTYQVRDYAPRLATRFDQVLVSDLVELRVEDSRLIPVRPVFQGKLRAEMRLAGSGPWFLSIRTGAFDAKGLSTGRAEVVPFRPELAADSVRVQPEKPFREPGGAVDLSQAERIVAVGRGVQDRQNIPMVEELARALGAEIAASRPVCDNGWLPLGRQVGSSGQTVAPKLYLALGISGAIQHLVGTRGAEIVVAVNKDPDAPIFEVADYGIVGDLLEIVPALTKELAHR